MNSDEYELLSKEINAIESRLLNQEISQMQNKIDWLDGYVRHMTYFCSGVGVLLIFILYKLI
jgi:hypothetical protein